jgi:hypothetical protein
LPQKRRSGAIWSGFFVSAGNFFHHLSNTPLGKNNGKAENWKIS